MDLDLSDDQVALRDGIASMLEGRFDSDRIRAGFDRAMFDELAEAGVFSLRADGFSLGRLRRRVRAARPVLRSRTARRVAAVRRRPDHRPGRGRRPDLGRASRHARRRRGALRPGCAPRSRPARSPGAPSTWPLDPLTPDYRAVEHLPAGNTINADAAERRREGATLTAALQLGLADRCTELAVAYAKERVQFDRPIAAFQAIKHLCADMLVRTEVARAAVYAAGAHLDDVDLASYADLDRGISGAKVMAGEAAIVNGKAATQVFGGMGFTWEVDVHLYLKRAWVLDSHFGSADMHADVVAARARRLNLTLLSRPWRDAANHGARGARASVSTPIPTARISTSPASRPSSVAYTAREMDAEATRLAHALSALGVGHGDRVATLLDNRAEQVVSFFAALKLGAVQVPINTAYKGEFLRHQLSDSGAKVFIVQGDYVVARGRDGRSGDHARRSRTASSSTRPMR